MHTLFDKAPTLEYSWPLHNGSTIYHIAYIDFPNLPHTAYSSSTRFDADDMVFTSTRVRVITLPLLTALETLKRRLSMKTFHFKRSLPRVYLNNTYIYICVLFAFLQNVVVDSHVLRFALDAVVRSLLYIKFFLAARALFFLCGGYVSAAKVIQIAH